MQRFVFSIPFTEFKDVESLLRLIPEKIIQHLSHNNQRIEIRPPDGDNIKIEIIHPIGETWGNNEIRVAVEYFTWNE